MRNLGDWENKKVLFSGFIENWKVHNGLGNIMLSNVTLRLIDKPEKRYFNHLWIQNYPNFKNIEDKIERLHKVFGTATVIQYQRQNGTTDFSINYLSGKYSLEKIMHDLNTLILKNSSKKKIKDKASFMKEVLLSKDFLVASLDFDYQERLNYCQKVIDKLKYY